ncbi:hypothetical protein OB905_07235 [Halobacteria archaeon AArc-dxtr1]|nr:hypothetical protein [Halobacteria archaeon AArc-dxtr1]
MRFAHIELLEEFGTRSLVVHGLMVLAFVNAILAGLLVGGQIGLVSFVALVNITAGLWVAHSVHSLGNAIGDDEYAGVVNELFRTRDRPNASLDIGRFGRLLLLVSVVTAIALLTSAQVLSGTLLPVAIVALGAIAVVTAIIGFLISMGSSYDSSQIRTIERIDRFEDDDPVAE